MSLPASVARELGKIGEAKHRAARSNAAGIDDDQILENLSAMSDLEYERERENAAKALGCRTSVLDRQVNARRPKQSGDVQGSALEFEEIEPWPESVSGAEVLNELAETFSRYVVLRREAADALALWVLHTYVFFLFVCSPRLNITSPEKGCGKTTLRDVIACLVPRPLATENLTVAVLFRVTQSHKPVLLADECDTWIKESEDLRGLLNGGHRRGGKVFRCEGEKNEVRGFHCFAPVVLCGIGSLPGTLHDRSIVIKLERAKPDEIRERFDSRKIAREQELCRKIARFVADNSERIETCDPVMPPGAFNRVADNWRPLISVAEIVGDGWRERALAAYVSLTSKQDADALGLGVILLSDIQKVFRDAKTERLFSKTLIDELLAMTDQPWLEAHRGRAITETWLARRLRGFGIHPATLRINAGRAKGYELSDFQEAFARYIEADNPIPGLSKRDTVTTEQTSALDENSRRDNRRSCHGLELQETPVNIDLSRCHASMGREWGDLTIEEQEARAVFEEANKIGFFAPSEIERVA
jgi:putative DNA primase/helicase